LEPNAKDIKKRAKQKMENEPEPKKKKKGRGQPTWADPGPKPAKPAREGTSPAGLIPQTPLLPLSFSFYFLPS
jgi:hypothetical protein